MSKKSQYISTNRSKHYLKCHLILVTKYRRNILIGQFNDDLKSIFQSIADDSDFEIEVMVSDINHIHFLIRYIPRLSISQLVRRLKQESTRQLWLLHHTTLRQYYWYLRLSIYKFYTYIFLTIWVCCHNIFRFKRFTRIKMIFHI
jgi:putative transposase